MSQRLRFVSDVGIGRNRPDAGRLGTRMSGGKPAPRWHEGVALARELDSFTERPRTTIGTRIHNAQKFLSQFFVPDS